MAQPATGVLQISKRGGGFLRDADLSFQPNQTDTWVSPKTIQKYGIVEGAVVSGSAEPTKNGHKLTTVDSICGLSPAEFQARKPFDRLLAINPDERIRLGDSGNRTMRVVELIAPIGRGTRGLIVSPPKSGKTRILEEMANAIRMSDPDTRIVVLLIDERPEEVTHFKRSVEAEVLSSSNDQNTESHTNLAELTLAHIRCELECGRNIVVLVDSLTRMGRAFNLTGNGARRTMSGGIDAKALQIPRRFFGLARNIEDGGSVTVIATALIDTGSRMDEYIFQEFKSTGNSEIVLDRSLADARIFPAVDIPASGTRREELLYTEDEMDGVAGLRRRLADCEPKQAMAALLKMLESEPSNDRLIERLARQH